MIYIYIFFFQCYIFDICSCCWVFNQFWNYCKVVIHAALRSGCLGLTLGSLHGTSYNEVQVISFVFGTVKWDVSIIYCYVTSCHKPSAVDQAPSSSRVGSPPQSCWQTSEALSSETVSPQAVHKGLLASRQAGECPPPSSLFPQGSADEGRPIWDSLPFD